jgi:thiazole/oxazole-forming peptide maturase SagD family component
MPMRSRVDGQARDEVRPWGAVSTVPHAGGIELLREGQRRLIKVSGADAELVWAVLAECDGFQSLEQIVRNVCERFPDRDPETVRDVLADLLEEGAVRDSREMFLVFHGATENPQRFGRGLTADEVIAYTHSPRLPITAGGSSYEIEGLSSGLALLQARRRSCRCFAERPLGPPELGHLLVSAYRLAGGPEDSRATPSGGALYPLKIYLIIARGTNDLPAGYYEYDPEPLTGSTGGNSLIRRLVRIDTPVDEESIGYAFDADASALPHGAPAAIVIAGDLMRDPFKYSSRGYRYTLIEAGLVLQNVVLGAAELGVQSLPYGGFRDAALATELGMDRVVDGDPARVRPLVTVALGYQNDAAVIRVDELADELERRLVGRGRPISSVRWRTSGQQGAFVTAVAHARLAANRRRVSTNSGRARSASLAKLRAVAEGFERYAAGIARVDSEASASRLTALGLSWLDPRAVVPLTAEQYAAMPWLQPFDEQDVLQWVGGRRAASGETVLVPADLVFYPVYANAWWNRNLLISASSNGVAAYTDEAGAAERALLELIERDAMMRSWFYRDPPPRIPTELLPYHWRRRVAYWQTQGRDVNVLDLSTAAYGAIVVEVAITSRTGAQPAFVSGAGASLASFEDALAKAFMEAQAPAEVISKAPFRRRIRPENVRTVRHHMQLYSFPENSSTLDWLFAGELASAVPEVHTEIDALMAELNPVLVCLAPLREKTGTVITRLSPGAAKLVTDAPLWVVRAISERLIPIHFGQGGGHYTHPTLTGRVAPESIRRPQYFA